MPKMSEDDNTFEFVKKNTHILKVHIHCDGCMQKVKKLLRKIEGVYEVKIEAEENKVTVSGDVECTTLIKKLAKSGKHAEIWPSSLTNHLENEEYLKLMQSMMDNDLNFFESANPNREDIDNWILANYLNNGIEKTQENNELIDWKENMNNKSFMEGDMRSAMNFPGFSELARPKSYYVGLPAYEYYGQPPATVNNIVQGPWNTGTYNIMHNDVQNMYPVSNVMGNTFMNKPRMMKMHPWVGIPPITNQYWNDNTFRT